MKVYVLTDLEGATGVVDYDYGDIERRRKDREFLIHDINAAVGGAFDAGAQTVAVYDGHGRKAVIPDQLDRRAVLIKDEKQESYLPGLDGSFTHLILVGAHSMVGAGGLLSHTYSRRVERLILNGEEMGEIGLSFVYALHYGVRPVFISGDDKAVSEARRYVSDIEGVAVKRTISERCGECLTPALTGGLIREGVKKALSNGKSLSRNLPSLPYAMEVIYKEPWVAFLRYLLKGQFEGVRIKNLHTITYQDTDFTRLMDKFIGSCNGNGKKFPLGAITC